MTGVRQSADAALHDAHVQTWQAVRYVLPFLRAGLALIPIPLGEKGPREKGWQRREAAIFGEENVQRFEGANAGILHEWSHTCAIDVDDHDAADAWLTLRNVNIEALFCADYTVSVSSGRANHGKLLYKLPDGVEPPATIKIKAGDERVALEFRCAGSQDIVAGRHPKGSDYTVNGDPAAMPVLPEPLWKIWQEELVQPRSRSSEKTPNGSARYASGGRNEALTSIAGKLQRDGLSAEALNAALQQINVECCDPPLEQKEVETIAESVGRYPPADDGDASEWPVPLDLEALAQRQPQPPRFVLADWLPIGYATLLAGHGGVGKSAIGLHLAVCVALGVPFFGIATARRHVLYLSCEDREDVLHWRLAHVCAWLGLNMAELRGWLEILDLVGHDTVLWERDPHTGYTITPSFGRLAQRIDGTRPQLLAVDGVSDTFGGNENARTEVKRYVNALLSLVGPEGALLLLGHVAKMTAANAETTEGYSGSTQWHNAARARWYLYPETEKDEDDARTRRTGKLVLELQKSNLGRIDQTMTFEWDDDARLFLANGAFGRSAVDRKHRDETERIGILVALRGCAAATPPIVVPAAQQGRRTTFHVLSKRPEFPPSLARSARRFWDQVESLRQMNWAQEIEYRRSNRHIASQIVLTTEGLRQCAE